MLHVSSHWYFSAPHAASVSMLLSICFWLTACLCEPSKRCRVSLNKLMGSFIFGVPLFFIYFLAISENTVVWCLLKSCTQLAHDLRNSILTLNCKGGSLTNYAALKNKQFQKVSRMPCICDAPCSSLTEDICQMLSLFPCLLALTIVKTSNKGKIPLKLKNTIS